jgi:hypothetical protein
MKQNQLENYLQQLVQQAKADPKKAGILGVLMVVMVVLFVRAASSSTPTSAQASVNGAHSITLPDNLRGLPRPNSAVAELMKWADRPIPPALTRNFFVVNYEYYPQDGTKPAPAPVRLAQGDGFWDQLAKSIAIRADQKLDQEALREKIHREAAALKVQSTMMGASPKALINGQLVGVGDVVASFRVLKIEARGVILEREGIKLPRWLE